MARRKAVRPTRKNKRKFAKTANTVKRMNVKRYVNRGGIRL